MKKKHYLQPDSAEYLIDGTDGLLQAFSLTNAENASEYDNPSMDVKQSPYKIDWDDTWE